MEVEAFIQRWSHLEGGAERANYALFLTELCDVLEVPHPDPASASTENNAYVFERHVRKGDGTGGRIDLYRRGSFVLEAKQTRQKVGGDKFVEAVQPPLALGLTEPAPRQRRQGWDVLLYNARRQAEDYARELPQSEGWPPFILVCDVGRTLDVYADFRRMGKYEQFPDRRNYRIHIEDLRNEEIRDRLRAIWLQPAGLDPTSRAAKVTREIAGRLAEVSKALEADGHSPEVVATFLMRCLFTMFAEDVGLLPPRAFQGLLVDCSENPEGFAPLLEELWAKMDKGGFATSIRAPVRRFNGALFRDARVLPLRKEEIGELRSAAAQDWREVEPAIFGTLLEQALDPTERARLGAHYTPRSHVERLVVATVLEPLREDWAAVIGAAETKRAAGDLPGAAALVRAFHERLCSTRVLDPACGTGNFLYVTLDLMKRLEGEVLDTLGDLGGQEALPGLEGHTVDPHQFLGLELNPRAAAIAELVLWIGYLQLHFRTRGNAPSEPILRAFGNINGGEHGGFDAVLTWDGFPAQPEAERASYPNARPPRWPDADFIVGNPPFIGNKRLKDRLGERYVAALRAAYPAVPASVDLVMYWVHRASALLKAGAIRRFGFVTTNSITQPLNRGPVTDLLGDESHPCSIAYCVPDHPWVDPTEGAAVRVAMLVAARGVRDGVVVELLTETGRRDNSEVVGFTEARGHINAALTLGPDVSTLQPLRANRGVAHQGVIPVGEGFRLSPTDRQWLIQHGESYRALIRPYLIGQDLTGSATDTRYILDVNHLTEQALRDDFPAAYQLLIDRVRPGRLINKDRKFREEWWRFGRSRPEIRELNRGISTYIATCRTARHRIFTTLPTEVIPDTKIIYIGLGSAASLAVLSSRIHVDWSKRTGGWLGAGNDSSYNHSICFDTFPFPDLRNADHRALELAGENLEKFRRARQAEHPELTLTELYNVREAVMMGRPLSAQEERVRDAGLVLVLNELHAEIDELVSRAYGWASQPADAEAFARLVALNVERAAEERRGVVRWLRPDYQKTKAGLISVGGDQLKVRLAVAPKKLPSFPRDPVEQSAMVMSVLAEARGSLDAPSIAARFARDRRTEAKVAAILAAFVRTGIASTTDGGQTFRARQAA